MISITPKAYNHLQHIVTDLDDIVCIQMTENSWIWPKEKKLTDEWELKQHNAFLRRVLFGLHSNELI